MCKDVLKTICQLISIDIVQTILDVCIDNQLCQAKDLATQMERIAETRLLSLLGSQCLDWLQIEVVIQMEVVQILAVDQQIQHIVALTQNLKSSLDPIKRGTLEKLSRLEGTEQVSEIIARRGGVKLLNTFASVASGDDVSANLKRRPSTTSDKKHEL